MFPARASCQELLKARLRSEAFPPTLDTHTFSSFYHPHSLHWAHGRWMGRAVMKAVTVMRQTFMLFMNQLPPPLENLVMHVERLEVEEAVWVWVSVCMGGGCREEIRVFPTLSSPLTASALLAVEGSSTAHYITQMLPDSHGSASQRNQIETINGTITLNTAHPNAIIRSVCLLSPQIPQIQNLLLCYYAITDASDTTSCWPFPPKWRDSF